MTVTIYDGSKYIISLTSKDKRFIERYGEDYLIPTRIIYEVLSGITSWANNELGEECLFEVD